jgi:hypothetical protein
MACGGHRGAPLARFASLAALVALGKHLGMFVERTQNSNGEVRAAGGQHFCRRQANAIGGTRDQNLLVVHGTAIQG